SAPTEVRSRPNEAAVAPLATTTLHHGLTGYLSVNETAGTHAQPPAEHVDLAGRAEPPAANHSFQSASEYAHACQSRIPYPLRCPIGRIVDRERRHPTVPIEGIPGES